MDGLLEQMRPKFNDKSQVDSFSVQQRRGLPQKKVSFKKDKKNEPFLFQGQIYNQTRKEDNSAELEFMAAIAATAYAIILVEEDVLLRKKKPIYELESSLTKMKNKEDEKIKNLPTENGRILRYFGAKEADNDGGSAAGNSYDSKPSTLNERFIEEKGSIKKTPTFSNKYLNETDYKPMPYHSGKKIQFGGRTLSLNRLQKADEWEETKLERIRKRHEKMNNTIIQWENEKKVKVKRQVERKERDLEKKQAQLLQEFHEKMKKIDMIAAGARAVADDARRSDELWAMKKAKRMRSTVKDRRKCLCF